MKKKLAWLDLNFEPFIAMLLFFAIMILLGAQVVLRFGFSTGFSWGEEVSRFMFIWLMYFCFAYATRNQRHIRISFFAQLFGTKVLKFLYLLSDFLFLGFALIILRSIILLVSDTAEYNDRAVTVDISLNWVYVAGLVGFVLMSIRLIQTIVWKFRHMRDSIEVYENYAGVYNGANDVFFNPNRPKTDTVNATDVPVGEEGGK